MGRDYEPVLIALLVAFPVAWLLMNQWLSGFAYRVKLEPMVFLIALVATVGISLFTISFRPSKQRLLIRPRH